MYKPNKIVTVLTTAVTYVATANEQDDAKYDSHWSKTKKQNIRTITILYYNTRHAK